jgi:DNA-binding NtrC family response regulator
LRERREDIAPLARVLLKRAAARNGIEVVLSGEALDAIVAAPWPGNVRQLENAIERATILSSDGTIHASDVLGERAAAKPASSPKPVGPLAEAVEDAERAAISAALENAAGNREVAARTLGISVRSLFYRLKKYGI